MSQPYYPNGGQPQYQYPTNGAQYQNNQQQYGMQPSQPYAPPPQQQQQQQYMAPDKEGQRIDKFAPAKPKWNDLFFALLFYAQFAAFIAISVISLRALSNTGSNRSGGL